MNINDFIDLPKDRSKIYILEKNIRKIVDNYIVEINIKLEFMCTIWCKCNYNVSIFHSIQ